MSEAFSIGQSENGYFIRDAEGTRVSRVFRCEGEAEQELARLKARTDRVHRIERRSCLCCGRGFMSQGAYNRLCNDCSSAGGPPELDRLSTSTVRDRSKWGVRAHG